MKPAQGCPERFASLCGLETNVKATKPGIDDGFTQQRCYRVFSSRCGSSRRARQCATGDLDVALEAGVVVGVALGLHVQRKRMDKILQLLVAVALDLALGNARADAVEGRATKPVAWPLNRPVGPSDCHPGKTQGLLSRFRDHHFRQLTDERFLRWASSA